MDAETIALEKKKRAKRRIQLAAYRLIHLLMIVFASLSFAVAVFVTISFQVWDWITIVFWSALFGSVLALVISALDDVYAYIIVFIAIFADAGWNVYVMIIQGPTFYKILYAVFNPGYIPDDCPYAYCEGYRADSFWFFYLFLAAETGLVLCMLFVYYQLFTIESNSSKDQVPEMFPYMLRYLAQEEQTTARLAHKRE